MKKTLLLAGVASVLAFNANAANYNWMDEYEPYIGADYVYSYAKFGGEARHMKDSYNSGAVNLGVRMYDYLGLEAFYQQSGERTTHKDNGKYKSEFLAYGLDMYGYMPIMCSDFNLLGSLGLANYRVKFSYPESKSKHQNRIGYRAGVGVQWNFTEHLAARVVGRYTYLGMERLYNLKEVTAGLRYTF